MDEEAVLMNVRCEDGMENIHIVIVINCHQGTWKLARPHPLIRTGRACVSAFFPVPFQFPFPIHFQQKACIGIKEQSIAAKNIARLIHLHSCSEELLKMT
jgi:hypothetical protein